VDNIEASHMEVIKQYLRDHPEHEFKARKHESHWVLNVQDYDGTIFHQTVGLSFGFAVKKMSNYLSGVKENGSNGTV
jgi:hypothetical protein